METRPTYNAGDGTKIRPETLLPYTDPRWERPTGDEVRKATQLAGLTASATAKLVGVKDGRTVRKWIGDEQGMPYAAWRLLVVAAGLVDAGDVLGRELDQAADSVHEPRTPPGSVPLERAMVTWGSKGAGHTFSVGVEVVEHRAMPSDSSLPMSSGDCNDYWSTMTQVERGGHMLALFRQMILRDGLAPDVVERAMSAIEEWPAIVDPYLWAYAHALESDAEPVAARLRELQDEG